MAEWLWHRTSAPCAKCGHPWVSVHAVLNSAYLSRWILVPRRKAPTVPYAWGYYTCEMSRRKSLKSPHPFLHQWTGTTVTDAGNKCAAPSNKKFLEARNCPTS
ncbi:hypothetical protein TNIN_74581 [Trichonephila inaurata madagascariensis]|uniref:Uncharacterized protein n=1 Tax=Trichonephila inaurata madagascariensis TaxID=2747483 RepID=A0A8X6XMJ6_9ARAC|nr:hypothetical protein TNIN_74581 [Trichonephila inaurata madagascariensis]